MPPALLMVTALALLMLMAPLSAARNANKYGAMFYWW